MAMTKKAEDDLIYLALLHAEQDVSGLVDAFENIPKDRKPWEKLLRRFKAYRARRFPDRRSLRDHIETIGKPTPIQKLTGGPNRPFKSP